MAEGDAHVDLLQIAGRLADVALRVLEVEVVGPADAHDAPGLPVHGRGSEAHHLERGLDVLVLLPQRRPKVAVEEQRIPVLPLVGLRGPAHQRLAHRHLRRGVAEGADAGHKLPGLQARRLLKERAVHRPADPGRADAARPGKEHQLLEGEADRLLDVGLLVGLGRDVQRLARDDRAREAVGLRVQKDEVHLDPVGVFDRAREVLERRAVLRRERPPVKAAHAPSRFYDVHIVHVFCSLPQ